MASNVPKAAIPNVHRQAFRSLDEFVNTVSPDDVERYVQENKASWTGLTRKSSAEAYKLGREGWTKELPEALRIAESAISKVETDHTMPVFVPVFDVCGSDVDMGRYMSGEPECMVDYPLAQVVKAGRVITLCASMSVSGAVDAKSIVRQGQAVVALALALSQLGYAIEIWSDLTGKTYSDAYSVTRVLVKSADDVLDPERIMFALAHPAMLRVFTFAALMRFSSESKCNTTMQIPHNPIEDLPEGTLYLPAICSSSDVPDADAQLLKWLRQLEIVTD